MTSGECIPEILRRSGCVKVFQSNPSQFKEQRISQVVAELRAQLSCSSVSEYEHTLQPGLAFRRWILNECLEIVFLSSFSLSLSLLPLFSHSLPRLPPFPLQPPTRGSYEPSTPLVKFPWWQVICPSTSLLCMWHTEWHAGNTWASAACRCVPLCIRHKHDHKSCYVQVGGLCFYIFFLCSKPFLKWNGLFFPPFLNNTFNLYMFILSRSIIHALCKTGQLHQITWTRAFIRVCFDRENQNRKSCVFFTVYCKFFVQHCLVYKMQLIISNANELGASKLHYHPKC